jgi:hypothetical protein
MKEPETMPELHDLFDAASDDLPPLPDLLPDVHRAARRRTLTAGAATGVGVAVLVGISAVGLFAVRDGTGAADDSGSGTGALNSGPVGAFPSENPSMARSAFETYAAGVLQAEWPLPGERIAPDGATKSGPPRFSVLTAQGKDEIVMSFERLPKNATQQAKAPCATGTPQQGADIFACGKLSGGDTVTANRHDSIVTIGFVLDQIQFSLDFSGPPTNQMTTQQMLTLGESTGLRDIFTDAVASGLVKPMQVFTATPRPPADPSGGHS